MIKNILVVRNDRFGEFLLNIPALRAIKQTYPQAKITLAVSKEVEGLAKAIEYADVVVIWDVDFRKSLRRHKFDVCVILNPSKEAHTASLLAGIPVRVGYNRKWGFLLTHKIADKKDLGLKHEIDSNLELVSLIGADTKDKSLSLGRLPVYSNTKYMDAVAVHPFTSDPRKDWPIERFQGLINKVTRDLGNKVIIIGKLEDINKARDFSEVSGETVINLVNKTTLVELANILKQCKLLVTGDSGPMHMACAVGTPVIALFRNDLPGKTALRWGPKSNGSIIIENNNLSNISVDEVFVKIREVLNR